MGAALTLFRVRGIPVRVHVSWLVVYGLIAWSLAVGYFPRVLPDLPVATHWATGLVAALLLFVSVFLHELSHSLVARRQGLHVSAITLHIFGGVSELAEEPRSPGEEFWMAIVGPLTSFGLAVFAGVGAALAGAIPVLSAILGYLTLVNTIVGAFNLVPGFPLDGGRVLRAALWKAKRDLYAATAVASRVGGAVAIALMALGVVRGLAGDFLGGLWLVLIGVERQATSHLARLQAAAGRSRDRVTEAVEASHRRMERLMRASEPAFRRALEQAEQLQETVERTRRGLKAGLRAGREAHRNPRPR